MSTPRTTWLLARMFFSRFFESELMPGGRPQVRLIVWGLAILAAPGFMASFRIGRIYQTLWRDRPAQLADAVMRDQLLFVTFGMMALGLIALLVWEGVFPDRRDVRILGILPLPARTHVVARLAALGAVAALFCVGANLLSAIAFGPTLWSYGAAPGPLRAIAGHLAATTAGGLFAFYLLIALQGVLLNVFGRRAAQRLALVFQTIFMVVILQALMLVPSLNAIIRTAFDGGSAWPAIALPPAWFLALYAILADTTTAVPTSFAWIAVGATLTSVGVAVALIAGSYRRLVRMALETMDGGTGTRTRVLGRATLTLARILTPDPVQRAVAGFTLRTIARTRSHLMLLAMTIGVAIALILSAVTTLIAREGVAALDTPRLAIVSAPLVLNFLLLAVLRLLIGIPTELKANWTFRLHASETRLWSAIRGVRSALLIAVVPPVACAAGLIGVTLWGVWTGTMHAVVTAAFGVLLVDVLLIGLRQIPFTCACDPGRSSLPAVWPFWLSAFAVYSYTLGLLEADMLLTSTSALQIGLAVVVALIAVLTLLRRRMLQPPPGLTYHAEYSDDLFEGFRLSEGLAAESPAPPVTRRG